MKVLVISSMDYDTIISVEINESFLYHLHTGIQTIHDLKAKLEGYPTLNIEDSGFMRFSTYKLGKAFSRELEARNSKLPEDGIEYLLVDQTEDIVFTEEQKNYDEWKVIEYPSDYYDNPVYENYFKNLERVYTRYENCKIIIEDGCFFIELHDMAVSLGHILGCEIKYSDFEKEIKGELNLNYKPVEKKPFLSKYRVKE
ncbi:hypothetical protein [Flavobacterium sp.]|uniref:hypothetical protein n=1 Tax=Flavobacterium sp. TaxID=239 RepID=UPI002B4B09D9|nr:hypothetical protein [Flavobacterium sp.]HLF53241.1 hypothetical protein [Flavobacterium sp.]